MQCPKCGKKVKLKEIVNTAFENRYVCSDCKFEIEVKNRRATALEWVIEILSIPITFILVFYLDLNWILIVLFLLTFFAYIWLRASKWSLNRTLSNYIKENRFDSTEH